MHALRAVLIARNVGMSKNTAMEGQAERRASWLRRHCSFYPSGYVQVAGATGTHVNKPASREALLIAIKALIDAHAAT